MTITTLSVTNVASGTGLDTDSALLPPDGSYVAPSENHEYSTANISLDSSVLYDFTNIQRNAIGDDEQETFDAVFTADEIDQGLGLITLTGPVQVLTTDRLLSTTGLFDAEIVSMSLSSGNLMIREDPDRDSIGETEIIDLGGGLYHIDSFFDVYTEFSLDGGSNWYDSDDSTRMYLIPEPATIILFSLGALALRRRRRA
jgi:hypothetical protein